MLMDNETQVSKLGRLLDTWTALGEVERTTLLTIAMRLKVGQKLHGPLTYEKKKWDVEALEEHLDSCVYSALRLGDSVQAAFDRSVAEAEKEVVQAKLVPVPTVAEIEGLLDHRSNHSTFGYDINRNWPHG